MGARIPLASVSCPRRALGDHVQREGDKPGQAQAGGGSPALSLLPRLLLRKLVPRTRPRKSQTRAWARLRPCPSLSLLPRYEVYLSFLGLGQHLTTNIYANEIMSNLGKGMKC